jgi:DNA polymerase-4
MNSRLIIHADLNSFFATAEQQVNPALRGKPVGVVKGEGRACIIASSVEAKKRGVGTGSNVYDARRLCPDIVLVPADFAKYEYISRQFIEICASYSPTCEAFSLDECFIDVTESERIFGNVFNIAFEIKRRLREVGDYLTCSVGISHNRLLAKLAGEQIKPDGLFWITDENKLEVLDRSELTDVCGLGFGLYRHLTTLGIDSFPKLRSQSMEFLQENFGPHLSVHLYNICRGIDDTGVTAIEQIPDAKSVGRTYTTHRNLTKPEEIEALIRNLCEEAAFKARRMGLAGRYVGLALRSGSANYGRSRRNEEQRWYGHKTLKQNIGDGAEFFRYCMAIARSWDITSVRFCGVFLGMLEPKNTMTTPLFAADRRREKLVNALDFVNDRYGDYTVFPAKLARMPLIMPEVTGYFGDKAFRLKHTRI